MLGEHETIYESFCSRKRLVLFYRILVLPNLNQKKVGALIMKYEELPKAMQEGAIKPYWDLLQKKKGSLILKRLMDIVASFLMLVILSPFY